MLSDEFPQEIIL